MHQHALFGLFHLGHGMGMGFHTQLFSDKRLYVHLGPGPFVFLAWKHEVNPTPGCRSNTRPAATPSPQRLQPRLHFSERNQLRNLGEARFLGGELGLSSSLTSRLKMQANYTYLSRRNMTHPAFPMIDTPRYQIYGAATYQLGPRISLLADMRYEGGRYY